jgi:hypothetical protein
MDASMPGVPPWDEIVRNPLLWHFDFGGPDAGRLVKGPERIHLDRFWGPSRRRLRRARPIRDLSD